MVAGAKPYAEPPGLRALIGWHTQHLGAAFRTKQQGPFVAAGGSLVVSLHFTGHVEVCFQDPQGRAKGATRDGLAIRAVADNDALRINFRAVSNGAAVADEHGAGGDLYVHGCV